MKSDQSLQEFCQNTDTFSLQVSLKKDRLKIRLKDFVDWTIYEKQYSEEDIGLKEIHKKADLLDIFNALAQFEMSPKKDPTSPAKIPSYNYGDIIKNGDIDCFKIERNGRITVYLKLKSISLSRLIECNSNLILNKVKPMTDVEISVINSKRDQKNLWAEYQKKIEKYKSENHYLHEKIEVLQQQNLELREIIKKYENEKKVQKKQKAEKPTGQRFKIVNGKYRIKSSYDTYLRANMFWIVDLANSPNKWEEWSVDELTDGFVSIRSWSGNYLSGNPEGKVGVQNNVGLWQHWQIVPKGKTFFIKSSRGTYLRATKKGSVQLTDHPGSQEQWKLIS